MSLNFLWRNKLSAGVQLTMSMFTNPITAAKDEADAYINAVLKLLGDKEPLTVLGRLVAELENLVSGFSDEELRRPEAPGKWSILEVIHHLADSELVWAYRLRMVLAEKQPQITGYDQDRWASQLKYREANPEDVLELLGILRKTNLRLIRSLSDEEMQRAGFHNERGEETVEHMIRLYAGHDLVHLNQIARIRKLLVSS